MKREFSDAQRKAVKKNLEKARAVRTRKKEQRIAATIGNVDLLKVETSIRRLLTTMAVRFGDYKPRRVACILCENKYVPGKPNSCVCQDGWLALDELEKLNGNRERGEAGSTDMDSGLSKAVC